MPTPSEIERLNLAVCDATTKWQEAASFVSELHEALQANDWPRAEFWRNQICIRVEMSCDGLIDGYRLLSGLDRANKT